MKLYRSPDGTIELPAAGFVTRVIALGIDWLIGFVIVWVAAIVAGPILPQSAGKLAWLAIPAVGILVYFTLMYRRGATAGMRVVGIRLVDKRTGGRPRVGLSLARAGLALLAFAASCGLVVYGLSDPPLGGYSATERLAIDSLLAIFAVSLVGRLWMLIDPERRTIFDRLLGTAVLEKQPQPAAKGGPTAA